MGDEGEITSGSVADISSSINGEGQEINSLSVPLPTDLVAGKSYRVELDKGVYTNFYAFEAFTIPPAVFELPAGSKEVVCEDTLKIPGRYFGETANDVRVFLDRDGLEVSEANVLAVAPGEIQVKVPSVYSDTYQIRVVVNGEEGIGDNVKVLPRITQLTASALPGGTITVQGCAFIDATHGADLLTLTLQKEGEAVIPVTSFTVLPALPNEMQVTLPENLKPGTYSLNVTVNGTLATGITTFVVLDPTSTSPSIESFSPAATAAPGETRLINGKNLGADGTEIFVLLKGRPSIPATANEEGTAITFTLPTDLPTGTYQVSVTIGNEEADGTLTLTVTGGEDTLGTPSVTSGQVTDSSFVLSWNAIGGADSYRVEVNTDASFVVALMELDETIADTTITVPDLMAETTYHYRVRSQNILGKESGTDAQQITTPAKGEVVPDLEIQSASDNPTTYLPVSDEDSLRATATGLQETDQVQLKVEGLSNQQTQTYDATASPNGRFGVPLSSIEPLDDPLGIEYQFLVQGGGSTKKSTETVRIYREYPLADMTLYKADKEQPQQSDYQLVALPFQDQAVTTAWIGANSFDEDSI